MSDTTQLQQRKQTENQKFVSIIIPTFNESNNIINLLKQIQSHIPPSLNIEIIVVDDNSPDGTGHIVEKYIREKNELFIVNGLRNKQIENSVDNISSIMRLPLSSTSISGVPTSVFTENTSSFDPLRIRTNSNQQKSNQHTSSNITIKIIHRKKKNGLISAVLNGISSCKGQNIIIMDADFSHPPKVIKDMIMELKKEPNCIVIGSRYIDGGAIKGMSLKRSLLSITANFVARHGLCLKNVYDPMSGFFAFPKHTLQDIEFNTNGFKILLEILIKKKNTIKVKEIPYTFEVRKHGYSKLDKSVIVEYIKAIWKLYRYGRKSRRQDDSTTITAAAATTITTTTATATLNSNNTTKLEQKKSVRFISKAARFYTVGASGFVLNYLISMILSNGTIANLDYLQAISIGIGFSVTTNFLLNKFWTFEDKNILPSRFIKQYGSFIGCSSLGIIIQFLSVFMLKEWGMTYDISLLLGVTIASVSNFLFNKKWTFKEKIWD